ncbi:MAG: TetR/AcrR family transcriptional regulator [Solobacterium sp.]|nr:TetR/AcrR family transcriptional regulator [Solobacterium sp.]
MAKRGITRENIIDAAAKVFLTYGYEQTSVRMILEEADVVTGSFYHFFPSKEALFEAVIERFLDGYTQRISAILNDENMEMEEIMEKILNELKETARMYYDVLQGDRLHWTVQTALHDRTLAALVQPMAQALARLQAEGTVRSHLHVDDMTLAGILINGTEAILHSTGEHDPGRYSTEKTRNDLMEFWKRIISF